jgi:hypothetical protein
MHDRHEAVAAQTGSRLMGLRPSTKGQPTRVFAILRSLISTGADRADKMCDGRYFTIS